jgi:periplasmic protein TonB
MNHDFANQLDEAIDQLLAGDEVTLKIDSELCQMFSTARELMHMPSPVFRARLRSELLMAAAAPSADATVSSNSIQEPIHKRIDCEAGRNTIAPLFSSNVISFPLSPSRLAISFALHVIALAVVSASSMWLFNSETVRTRVAQFVPITSDFLLPVAPGKIGGGGGGGDHDKMSASKGTPPRFSTEQLTPPAAVVRNDDPKLTAEPTVVGPPDVLLPQSDKRGDPLAAVLARPSNGTGGAGGIGDGYGGGVGPGYGPGVGEGFGGGIGGGIYTVGGGVSAPHPIYDPDPEYSDEARKAKYQGNVVLRAVIAADGRPRGLQVVRSLGMGLDQKALDAVSKWRFSPAVKDGRPVAVQVDIEVAFRLY